MEKSINLVILETKEKLINVLVESKLPIVISSMILNEITHIVNSEMNQIVENEKKALNNPPSMPTANITDAVKNEKQK